MIAFDAFGSGGNLPGGSFSFSHTCSGSDRILLVYINTNGSNGDKVTGVTYNSVAMTRANNATLASASFRSYIYYLIAPATGANNVTISLNASDHYVRAVSASYTGALQSSQPNDTDAGNASPGTSVSVTSVSTVDKCWMVSGVGNDGANALTGTTGIGANRGNINNVVAIGDTNANITPAGSQQQTWTSSSQGLVTLSFVIAPAPEIEVVGGYFHMTQ